MGPTRIHLHPWAWTKGTVVITTSRGIGRTLALLVTAAVTLLAAATLAGPAQAASYRYWSYWLGASGSWEAAMTGPGDQVMVDRDVQGWRFSITSDMPSEVPDNAPDFDALCPDVAAGDSPEGQVRVAVVVDPGFVAAAPQGQTPPRDVVSCLTLPEGSTGNQALAAAAALTADGGLVCAINGYPEGECGAEIPDDVAAQAARASAEEQPNPAVVATGAAVESSSSDSTALILTGAFVIAGLLAAAFAIPRLRRRASVGSD